MARPLPLGFRDSPLGPWGKVLTTPARRACGAGGLSRVSYSNSATHRCRVRGRTGARPDNTSPLLPVDGPARSQAARRHATYSGVQGVVNGCEAGARTADHLSLSSCVLTGRELQRTNFPIAIRRYEAHV